MSKKKWGDRSDAVWLKDLPSMNRIMPSIMPNRADNEAFISFDLDLRPLEAYLEKKNQGRTEDKYTFFHVISCAVGKAFVLRPKMNRFVCNHKVYQKNDIVIAFTVKKRFSDKAEEGLANFKFDPKDTMDTYHQKIMDVIHATKREDIADTSTGAMDIVSKLPQWVINFIAGFVLWLDKRGWAPQSLIGSDPNHSSIFLSNLGSIRLQSGYHHLTNWGTNSIFVAVGQIKMRPFSQQDGSLSTKNSIDLDLTIDERLADGCSYSKTVRL